MTIDATATYRLETAAEAAGFSRAQQYNVADDLQRHESKLNDHDKDIRALTESVTMLAASVKFQSRTPFVLALVALGLVVIALIGIFTLAIVVL